MPHESDRRLLVLHALRLKSVAEPPVVADAVGLASRTVAGELAVLEPQGLVVRRSGRLNGWMLTPVGRRCHRDLLEAELDAARARPAVEAGYRRFRGLNPTVLRACSRWQVREVCGRAVPNDHADPAHDARVLADLESALASLRPVSEELTSVLHRYRIYRPRLEEAMARVRHGDDDYVTKPVIPSVHTVWFELHEDLLATLGLDRCSEAGSTVWEGKL